MNEAQLNSIVADLSMALEKAARASDLDVLRLDAQTIACYHPAPLIFLGVAGPSVPHISHRMSQSSTYMGRVFSQRGVPFSKADPADTLRVLVLGDSVVFGDAVRASVEGPVRDVAIAAIRSLPGAAYGCVSIANDEPYAVTSVDLTVAEWASSASKADIEQVADTILHLELAASHLSELARNDSAARGAPVLSAGSANDVAVTSA